MDNNTSYPGSVAVVIVAAGRGERAGLADGPKQYRKIGGQAVIAWTIKRFLEHPAINKIVIAIHRDDQALLSQALGKTMDAVSIVIGGDTRQESTLNALISLEPSAPDVVLIHDGVRPFADNALIDRVLSGCGSDHGCIAALPIVETVKEGAENRVTRTVARERLFTAQTPQGFPYSAILAAHKQAALSAESSFTDDASIAEFAGIPVRLIDGSADNIKLTYARDIEMANAKLTHTFPDVRTGNGYDVHILEPGEFVTLCGVRIPHDRRLSGHSDADVGLHALTDALLATCGAGDIGVHFPPSDPQWRGAASSIFLRHAAKIVSDKGGRIANIDVTLICEAPRIGPHREAMTAALQEMLGLSAERVSIKATTNEGIGFVGRKEGIAAIATASVVYPGEL